MTISSTTRRVTALAAIVITMGLGAIAAAPAHAQTAASAPARTAATVQLHAAAPAASGSQLYATVTGPTMVHPAASADFTCPNRTVCLFQDAGLTGNVCEFPMPADGNVWWALRSACGFTIPWGSLNDNTGSRVIFRDAQTGAEYCEPAGYRGTPSSAVRNTGYMYIQYGVPGC